MSIKVGDSITFKNGDIYIVEKGLTSYYLKNKYGYNDDIFKDFKIINKYEFASKIYGYETRCGDFPFSESLEDLERIINKLKEISEYVN